MSGSDATDGAGSAAAERPRHTPTPRAGQGTRQKDLFGHLWGRHHRHDTGLHSCRPALATTAAVNSGHFVVQDANSVCPPSRLDFRSFPRVRNTGLLNQKTKGGSSIL